ncbi:Actin-related protein 2/3 complex subunit 3 [Zea mays]|nr:Actin-related protein 2/3 complex subunit 3 [Zea mays]AQK70322.1 Actin-related protein 2/3 complex subunit 3 [Zea mays]AQK70324.1 hypothetical protein ZEAMMB73_Zm00001d016208 [Zea mays]ONM52022.1 Actin-related protein 2/3 complex subunit 3 [Zea mays]ONM63193.1 Actin-related protein 2/3 complex subunit 3 [Zea mays]
MNIVIL